MLRWKVKESKGWVGVGPARRMLRSCNEQKATLEGLPTRGFGLSVCAYRQGAARTHFGFDSRLCACLSGHCLMCTVDPAVACCSVVIAHGQCECWMFRRRSVRHQISSFNLAKRAGLNP
jgi:hypothetical protein